MIICYITSYKLTDYDANVWVFRTLIHIPKFIKIFLFSINIIAYVYFGMTHSNIYENKITPFPFSFISMSPIGNTVYFLRCNKHATVILSIIYNFNIAYSFIYHI